MGSSSHKEYADFLEKVKRTVYIDNLGPQVTAAVLRTALGQFGNVVNVQFIPNYMDSLDIPQCALVEMETQKQAKAVVVEMTSFHFMMSGMPRPVRAKPAEPEMFSDRPVKPGRKIQFRWVGAKDPHFEAAQKLKDLTRRHAGEAALLLKSQLEEEEKLAKHQDEMLKTNSKKYEMLDTVMYDGTLKKLARHYKIEATED